MKGYIAPAQPPSPLYHTGPWSRQETTARRPELPSLLTLSVSGQAQVNPLSMQDWNRTTAYAYDNDSRPVQTGGFCVTDVVKLSMRPVGRNKGAYEQCMKSCSVFKPMKTPHLLFH